MKLNWEADHTIALNEMNVRLKGGMRFVFAAYMKLLLSDVIGCEIA
jgi:hypothetical protein